ncbi:MULTISPECIES: pentapeptide repeat-containing protein [Planktothricoides]|uniref:Pentapeptide repeat-containing protein n=2 Tax=Planktothricoides raciborskii TaxID=132608 RepID=A0AAU8JGZ8_9CYAN|nr:MULTISPECIES: pentapeptide repeat-containing protein [Planktothricoides]MBD2544773.1 pentapeptide repeat-containing protein [Planktothricoides raciborskii FACHB-1370]MBD2582820.1 pentapeptide repeat-containing protein [Planktothricoides raciborskii FACHB-1261]
MFDLFKAFFNGNYSAHYDKTDNHQPLKTTMNGREFRERLEKGDRQFNNLLLSKVDLRELDLSNLVLTDSILQDSDLSYACLINANFSRTKCDRSNFTGSLLNGANLFEISLCGANLSHCHAINVNFSRADLTSANLTWTNLRGANLYRTNLTGVNLSGANLEGANFEHSSRDNIDLKMLRLSVGSRIIQKTKPGFYFGE